MLPISGQISHDYNVAGIEIPRSVTANCGILTHSPRDILTHCGILPQCFPDTTFITH